MIRPGLHALVSRYLPPNTVSRGLMPSDVRVSEDPADGAAVRAAAVNLVADRSFQPELNAEYRRLERARQQMARHAERVDANRGGGGWPTRVSLLTVGCRTGSFLQNVSRAKLVRSSDSSCCTRARRAVCCLAPVGRRSRLLTQCGTRSDPSDNPLKRLIGEIHRRRCWSPHLGGLT